MKIFALLLIGILSFLWGYFSWKYMNIDHTDSLTLVILLAGMFVFGVLFGKISLFLEKSSPSYSCDKGANKPPQKNKHSTDFIPEIEPILEEKKKNKIIQYQDQPEIIEVEVKKEANGFSDFEHIPDNSFLNISNNLKKQKKQDLKIIEGIGPKIEEILNKGLIFSYKDLKETNVDSIKKLLELAGSRYSMHNPSTWLKQAGLADAGDLDGLRKYQSTLVKGVEQN